MEAAVVFALCHRWMGGTVIAGVRSVVVQGPNSIDFFSAPKTA